MFFNRFFDSFLIRVTCLILLILNNLNGFANQSINELLKKEIAQKDLKGILNKAVDLANSDFNLSLQICEKAEEMAKKMKDDDRLFSVYRDRGYIHELNNQIDESIRWYIKANELVQKTGNWTNQLDIYNDLAITHRKIGKYQETKVYHTKGLQLAKETNDLKMVEYNYHGLGFLYETIGDFEKAIDYYFHSLSAAEVRSSTSGVIITLQNIAITYLKINQSQKALESIQKAYQLALKEEDPERVAKVLTDYGEVLKTIGNYNLSLEKLQEALSRYEQLEQKTDVAWSLVQIGDVFLNKKEYDLAHEYFSKSLKFKEYLRIEDFANLHNKMGKLFQLQGNLEKAKSAYFESLQYSQKHSFHNLSQKNTYSLYQIFSNQKMAEEALQYLEQSIVLKDTLLNEKNSKNIAELQFKYDTEKSEKKIQELQFHQNRMFLIGGLIGLALLVLTLTIIIKIKAKTNLILVKKNQEIKEKNIKLIKSNEILSHYTFAAAHDLKEPLRNIGGFISLLKRKYHNQLDNQAMEYMEFVQNGASKMNALLTDLLKYAEISSSKKSESEQVNFLKLVNSVKKELEKEIENKNAIIDCPFQSLWINMNPQHLHQIIKNLMSNALKFSSTLPVIKIDLTVHPESILLTFEDNGIGIKKEYENKIFNLFYRLEKQKDYQGNGVGLTICKTIVEKYDGKIWLESKNNGGTIFFIALPVKTTASPDKIKILETASLVKRDLIHNH